MQIQDLYDENKSYRLSDEIYIVKDRCETFHQELWNKPVRLISGVADSDVIGYHHTLGWTTVCPADSVEPQWLGIRMDNLINTSASSGRNSFYVDAAKQHEQFESRLLELESTIGYLAAYNERLEEYIDNLESVIEQTINEAGTILDEIDQRIGDLEDAIVTESSETVDDTHGFTIQVNRKTVLVECEGSIGTYIRK